MRYIDRHDTRRDISNVSQAINRLALDSKAELICAKECLFLDGDRHIATRFVILIIKLVSFSPALPDA